MSNVFYANLDKKYKCVERAEGSWVYDTDGKKYLDCAAGIAVTNIGQGIKEVIDAMYQQASNVSYVYGGTLPARRRSVCPIRLLNCHLKVWIRYFSAPEVPRPWNPWARLRGSTR